MKVSRSTQTGLLAVGRVSVNLSNILLAAVLSRLFTKEDYGLYREVFFFSVMLAPLFRLGVGNALFYYLPQEPNRSRTILVANLGILTLTATIWAAVFGLGGNVWISELVSSPAIAALLLWLIPYGFLEFPTIGVSPCLTARDRVSWIVPYTATSRLAVVVAVLVSVWWFGTVQSAVIANILSLSVGLVLGLVIMFRVCPEWVGWPNLNEYRRQMAIGVPLCLSAFISGFATALDKLLVSMFHTSEDFAVYVNGAFQLPLVPVLLVSVSTVLMPNMSRLCSEGRDQEALDMFSRAASKTGRIVMAMFAFCFFFADAIIVLLFGEIYEASAIPFRLYLLTLPLRIIHFAPALFAKKKNHEILYGSILILGVNAAVSVPLLFWLGPNGAAWGTVAATYFAEVPFMVWRTSKAYAQRPSQFVPWRQALRQLGGALLLAVVAWAICQALPWSTPWVHLVIGATIFGIGWAIWQRHYLATLPVLSRILRR